MRIFIVSTKKYEQTIKIKTIPTTDVFYCLKEHI